jgi:hypothetical protein
MAYNRENLLFRIIEIQDLTMSYTRNGTTQEWVYFNVIRGRYYISKSTYYNYLAYPAKLELRLLQENMPEKEREKTSVHRDRRFESQY